MAKLMRSAPQPSQSVSRRVVASTNSIDRNGRRVAQNWQLANFQANPVLLFGHDADRLPIGTAQVEVVGEGDAAQLEATLEFDQADPFAARVAGAWDRGLLRAVSVGWFPADPSEVRDVFDDQTGAFLFTEYPRNELAELSVVPIPANPDAVRVAASLDFQTELEALTESQPAMEAKNTAGTSQLKINLARWELARQRRNRG